MPHMSRLAWSPDTARDDGAHGGAHDDALGGVDGARCTCVHGRGSSSGRALAHPHRHDRRTDAHAAFDAAFDAAGTGLDGRSRSGLGLGLGW